MTDNPLNGHLQILTPTPEQLDAAKGIIANLTHVSTVAVGINPDNISETKAILEEISKNTGAILTFSHQEPETVTTSRALPQLSLSGNITAADLDSNSIENHNASLPNIRPPQDRTPG